MAKRKTYFNEDDFEEVDLGFTPSLDLPHLVVDKFKVLKDGRRYMVFYTHMDKNWRPENGCPHCHSKEHLILSGTAAKARPIHDVIRNNYRVDILIFPPRMYCKKCNAWITPELDNVVDHRGLTDRLYQFIQTESFLQPLADLARRTGLDEKTISKIMDEEIEKYEKEREAHPPEAPFHLGIDEVHIKNVMRGTLVDGDTGALIDMTEDVKEETLKAAIEKLKDWKKNIKVVTTDMNNSYLKWLPDEFPGATIVVDKYHVIQNVERAVTSARKKLIDCCKKEVRGLADPVAKEKTAAVLRIVTRNPRLFNFNTERLTREKEGDRMKKIQRVISIFPDFETLYNLYHLVEHMYEQQTRVDAEAVWDQWQKALPPQGSKAYEKWCSKTGVDPQVFSDFTRFTHHSYQNFKPFILNYFNCPEVRRTNAKTETRNGIIKDVNRKGKGYDFKHLRAKALYGPLVEDKVNYAVDIKTFRRWETKDGRMLEFSTGDIGERCIEITVYEFSEERVPVNNPVPNIYNEEANYWLYKSIGYEPENGEDAYIDIDVKSILADAKEFYKGKDVYK